MRRVILGLILSLLVALFIGAASYEVGYFYHRGRISAENDVRIKILRKRAESRSESRAERERREWDIKVEKYLKREKLQAERKGER